MKPSSVLMQMAVVITLLGAGIAVADTEGMPNMPMAQASRTFTVKGDEDFKSKVGFGPDAPMVRMMNLMMVGGSGYEGMDMSAMTQSPSIPRQKVETAGVGNTSPFDIKSEITPHPPKVGVNQLDFSLVDRNSRTPAAGLSLHAEVFMTGMAMGTEEPKVTETSPGHYRVQVPFAMKGPWTVRIQSFPRDAKDRTRQWENIMHFDVD